MSDRLPYGASNLHFARFDRGAATAADDLDASFFPSSSAVNPALTIMANALRVAAHLAERLGVTAAARYATATTGTRTATTTAAASGTGTNTGTGKTAGTRR